MAGPLITPIKGFGKSIKAATKRLQFKIKHTLIKFRKSVYHVCLLQYLNLCITEQYPITRPTS